MKPYIILFPTTRCDVRCKHCMHRVTMEGIDIPIEYIETLINKLTKENLDATFCATGYGEPLLYPKIRKLADLILEKYGSSELSILTSGYNGNSKRRGDLLWLIDQEYSNRISLMMSYNLYADFDSRLICFLNDLNEMCKETFLTIKITVSQDNAKMTVERLLKLLINFAKTNNLPPISYCGTHEEYNWINAPVFLESRKCIFHGKYCDHKILIIYHTLSNVGKASSLEETPYYYQDCDCSDDGAENTLILFPDGHFYPCDKSIGNKNRCLGHINTHSITEMLNKKRKLVRCANKFLLPLERVFKKTPCRICKLLPL